MKIFKKEKKEVVKVRYTIDEVVDEFADHIYRAAYAYLGSGAEAQDVVSDVLMKYFSVCETLQINSKEHLKAWLLRTAINKCKDVVKSPPMEAYIRTHRCT